MEEQDTPVLLATYLIPPAPFLEETSEVHVEFLSRRIRFYPHPALVTYGIRRTYAGDKVYSLLSFSETAGTELCETERDGTNWAAHTLYDKSLIVDSSGKLSITVATRFPLGQCQNEQKGKKETTGFT